MMKTKYLLLLFFLIILSASAALLLWLARTGEYQTMGLVSLALSLSFKAKNARTAIHAMMHAVQ